MTKRTNSNENGDERREPSRITRRKTLHSAGAIGTGALFLSSMGIGAGDDSSTDEWSDYDESKYPEGDYDEADYAEEVMFGEKLDEWEVEVDEPAERTGSEPALIYVGENRDADPLTEREVQEELEGDASVEASQCFTRCLPDGWPVSCCLNACAGISTTGVSVSVTLCGFVLFQKGLQWGENIQVRAWYKGIRVTITVTTNLDGTFSVCLRPCFLHRNWCIPTWCPF